MYIVYYIVHTLITQVHCIGTYQSIHLSASLVFVKIIIKNDLFLGVGGLLLAVLHFLPLPAAPRRLFAPGGREGGGEELCCCPSPSTHRLQGQFALTAAQQALELNNREIQINKNFTILISHFCKISCKPSSFEQIIFYLLLLLMISSFREGKLLRCDSENLTKITISFDSLWYLRYYLAV